MEQPLIIQIIVVSLIALLATIGVYGLVALIVRMDDVGLFMIGQAEKLTGLFARLFAFSGSFLVASLPRVIRALGVIGTIAMLLVGGGMFTHNLPVLHHAVELIPAFLVNLAIGTVVGLILVAAQKIAVKIRS
jgi:predicted DNA repair protein MutK